MIGEWIADHLVPDLNGRISQKVLAEACHTWLFDQGRQGKESNAEIARRIEAHVPAAAAKRSNGDRLVVGIAWNARGQKLARRSVRRSVDIGTVVQQDPPVQEVEEPF